MPTDDFADDVCAESGRFFARRCIALQRVYNILFPIFQSLNERAAVVGLFADRRPELLKSQADRSRLNVFV